MRQWTIDAFAVGPFKGNPACVVEPLDAWPEAAWMQALAAENNQAETAFLLKGEDRSRFALRWFTPALEVPLCGHATLASAHVLLSELGLPAAAVTFDTQSGPLVVSRWGEGYAMDFPAGPPQRIEPPEGLARALGVEPVEVWAAQYVVAVLEDEAAVRGLTPDIAAIQPISATTTRGRGNVGVAAVADAGAAYDVVSRFFAPGSGVSEDPATGSLHCILSPMFAAKLGRPVLDFHQAYPGRGGDLQCEHRGDRVLIRGRAVTILEGRFEARGLMRLATIGYEGASLGDVIGRLGTAGVEMVIDVRAVASSRRPGFSKTMLAGSLAEAGIGYRHLRALGTPKSGREAARAGRIAEMRQIFEAHLEEPEAQAQLLEAAEIAAAGPCAILCYEADARRCHRAIVAERLRRRHGFEIVDL